MKSSIKKTVVEYVERLNDDDLIRLLTLLKMFFSQGIEEDVADTNAGITMDDFGRYHIGLPDKLDRKEIYDDRVK